MRAENGIARRANWKLQVPAAGLAGAFHHVLLGGFAPQPQSRTVGLTRPRFRRGLIKPGCSPCRSRNDRRSGHLRNGNLRRPGQLDAQRASFLHPFRLMRCGFFPPPLRRLPSSLFLLLIEPLLQRPDLRGEQGQLLFEPHLPLLQPLQFRPFLLVHDHALSLVCAANSLLCRRLLPRGQQVAQGGSFVARRRGDPAVVMPKATHHP